MSSAARRPRPGRPRHIPEIDSRLSPRDQILDVCARLFTQQGYAATSTRDIADAVGIRQASLYYYFAGKPGILTELLERSARPGLDTIARIEGICPPGAPDVALYLLALTDVRVLAAAPHNACLLHRFPDVRSAPVYEPFLGMLPDLGRAYGRLGVAVLGGAVAASMEFDQVRNMLVTVVEGVLTTRGEGESITRAYSHVIAEACLRACGVADERIEYAAATAMRLTPDLVPGSNKAADLLGTISS